ncbi:MAG: bacteriohemerythrin [Candidatus Binatia bacterium]
MALRWDERYVTGERQVDEQHKELFEFLNRLEEQIQKGAPPELVEKTLQFLGTHAKTHFSYEETCMMRYGCPFAAQNKEAHTMFLEVFQSFCQKFQQEGASENLLRQVHAAAETWMDNHICQVDVHLRDYVNA